MVLIRRIFFLLALSLPFALVGQSFSLKKDMSSERLKFQNDDYVRAEPGELLQTSYFLIRASDHDYLEITSAKNFSLFVNGKMATPALNRTWYNVDSLKSAFSS